jgi:tellurite resistance protein
MIEGIIGAVVCLVVLGIIGALFGDKDGASTGGESGELRIRVKDVIEKTEETGYVYPAFAIEAMGSIPVPHDQCPLELRLHIFDGTADDAKPVLSTVEQLQEQQTLAFEGRGETFAMPFHNRLANWETMFTIPKEILVFPAQGARRLTFQLCAIAPGDPPHFQCGFTDGTTGTTYALAQAVRSHTNEEEGYEDGQDNRRAAMHLSAELAMHVAAINGDVGDAETSVIKEWMKKVAAVIPEEVRKEEYEQFRRAVNDAYRHVTAGGADLNDVVQRMNEAASTQEKYEALELCMDVMAADGKAEAREIQQLNQIARMLRLDPKTYRSLREQRMAKLTDVAEVSGNLNTMLGISSDMTPEQVKRHLTAEYRKWNSRVSHPDEKIRKRAEEMLLLIGEARAKFVD